mgnify:CR=1 FL=1
MWPLTTRAGRARWRPRSCPHDALGPAAAGRRGWCLHLERQALHSGEVRQPRGWRTFERDDEPLRYWFSVALYLVCAALGLGYGGVAVYALLLRT